ncbi:hypothetical protein BHE74_00024159 [Ensete ventricosum]|nr:hypothetical protein BHE74_00024159 [Ensete ventricosum]
MNSCRGKSEIMSFHGFFILMGRTYLAWWQRQRELRGICKLPRDAFDGVTKVIQLVKVKLRSGYLSTGQEDAEAGTLEEYAIVLPFKLSKISGGMIRAVGELDYFSAHIRLREPGKSEDKVEWKATDSRAMGLAAPWYRRDGTSVESSIPCSHGGRALVVKGAKEVENAMTNSKY